MFRAHARHEAWEMGANSDQQWTITYPLQEEDKDITEILTDDGLERAETWGGERHPEGKYACPLLLIKGRQTVVGVDLNRIEVLNGDDFEWSESPSEALTVAQSDNGYSALQQRISNLYRMREQNPQAADGELRF